MKPSTIAIRRMERRDAAAVAALSSELGYPATPELMEERRIDIQTGPPQQPADILVAVDTIRDQAIGWVHVCVPLFLTGSRSASVWGIVVSSIHRGRGVGHCLMEAAETWAIDRGCEEMRLHSGAQRVDAHRFYDSLGYHVEKSQVVLARSLVSTKGKT